MCHTHDAEQTDLAQDDAEAQEHKDAHDTEEDGHVDSRHHAQLVESLGLEAGRGAGLGDW